MKANHSYVVSDSHQNFWEAKYAAMNNPSSGVPSAVLCNFTNKRKLGRALDLGCARGDDAVWLACQGWQVTGADISLTALDVARANAQAASVDNRTSFVRCDLSDTFPTGMYDLVSALFLQSPVKFDRLKVLRRASESVVRGGLLLVASHGSRAPWSWATENSVFPSAEEELAELNLAPDDWRRIFVGSLSRDAQGPAEQIATVIDNIIALERH